MKWDDCRYCNGGKMQPTGETRTAPHDANVTEVAHGCDSCQKHADNPLWVPDGVQATPEVQADYGDIPPSRATRPHHQNYAGEPSKSVYLRREQRSLFGSLWFWVIILVILVFFGIGLAGLAGLLV